MTAPKPETEQAVEPPKMSAQRRAEEDARARFMTDVTLHEMAVLHDDGLYRHLLFRAPSGFDWFEVITWPGNLTINGGHGTWTFARTEDMFQFFRSSRGITRINPSYWGEKLRGGLTCGNRLAEEYDEQVFLAAVKEHVDDFVAESDWPDEILEDLRAEVASQITDDWNDWTCEDGARSLLNSFDFRTASKRFRFDDAWEWDFTTPSSHFLWSCWAVAYAVQEYDRHLTSSPGQSGHTP